MVRLAITGRKQAAPAGCSGAPLARKLGVAKHQAPLAGLYRCGADTRATEFGVPSGGYRPPADRGRENSSGAT